MTTKEFDEKTLKQLIIDLKDIDNYKNFKHGSFIYDLGYYQGNLLVNEIDRLNNIIDTMLEFSFFKEECPLNFGFGDEKEEKAQDVFYEDDYCEENCNDIYKKCWLKYFNKLKELKDSDKE